MRKLLLCRPRGGLNDMFCQIDVCMSYAEKYDRQLWIDSRKSGFLDCLSNYFQSHPKYNFGVPVGVDDLPSCIPPQIIGRINSYKSIYKKEVHNFVDEMSDTQLTFDLSEAHVESILVHEQCGGGSNSINALSRFKLKPDLAASITEYINELGDYDAIHIRNTDYSTDYVSFFDEIESKINGKIVLCTDDFSCQEYAKSFFGDKLYKLTEIPNTNGRPLHMNNQIDRYTANISCLIDLFVLSSCKNIFYTKTTKGVFSGFSRLAEALHSNSHIIKNIL